MKSPTFRIPDANDDITISYDLEKTIDIYI